MAITTLIFGDSGLFKTTNAGFAAKYMYEKSGGKPIRYICADAGGIRPIQQLVDIGVIDLFDITAVPNPLVLLRKLRQGYWPDKDVNRGSMGLKLIPPPSNFASLISGYIIEGLTSISDLLMEDLRQKQRSIGQEPVGKFIEEDEKFCASSPAHYNFVQRKVLAIPRSFAALTVPRVIFTAHEARGEEADSCLPIRGPALAGTAATDKVPREVGDCVHFEGYSEEVETEDPVTKTKVKRLQTRVRAFFMPHPDPRIPNVLYKCKPRVPAEMIPELLKRWSGGYFEPTIYSGLDDFLRFEDELLARSSDRERTWKLEIDSKIRNVKHE